MQVELNVLDIPTSSLPFARRDGHGLVMAGARVAWGEAPHVGAGVRCPTFRSPEAIRCNVSLDQKPAGLLDTSPALESLPSFPGQQRAAFNRATSHKAHSRHLGADLRLLHANDLGPGRGVRQLVRVAERNLERPVEDRVPGRACPRFFNSIAFRTDHPSIVIVPFCDQTIDPSGSNPDSNFGGYGDSPGSSHTENGVVATVQYVQANFSAYANKTYVTGQSLGGIGTWALLVDHNQLNGPLSHTFTAGAPLSGGARCGEPSPAIRTSRSTRTRRLRPKPAPARFITTTRRQVTIRGTATRRVPTTACTPTTESPGSTGSSSRGTEARLQIACAPLRLEPAEWARVGSRHCGRREFLRRWTQEVTR